MKKVIEGKIYNTETAECLCDVGNNLSARDFHHNHSKLFVTEKGAFFVAGGGGPLSLWSVSVGNNGTSGSNGIYLVTRDEARVMLENRNKGEGLFARLGFEVENG
jgi:hypothetical protein